MTAREFFDLVASMRATQKEYFKTRSASALSRSRTLEKQVDAEIDRATKILKRQAEQASIDFK